MLCLARPDRYGTIGDPAEIANHVAMAHVLFNVALAAGLLPFTSQSATRA
jgi:Na+/phosphate symporter